MAVARIENTAVASYDDGGGPRTINSNTVTVRVDELLNVTVASSDPGPVSTRPGDAVLIFALTNQSNGPVADGQGCDANVTNFRVRPTGAFAAARNVTLRVRYIIE